MRGLVTLATALALPASFPQRDTIQLTALVVVLGTLIIQGLTLGPLIRLLKFERDDSFDRELKATRLTLINAALLDIEQRRDIAGEDIRRMYLADREMIEQDQHPRAKSDINDLKRQSIVEKRGRLSAMRSSGEIADDVYHALEQELDWAELAASTPDRFEIIEG
jgi:CPA1 family monovalent cation:H+ antiporter